MNIKSQGQSSEFNQKGVGRNNLVWVDWRGKIIHVENGFKGSENDRGMYNFSEFFKDNDRFLLDNETIGGDAIFQGPKGIGSRGGGRLNVHTDVFAPFNVNQLAHNPDRKYFNRYMHRYRVVVEQGIGSIKQWNIVQVPYRGDIELQVVIQSHICPHVIFLIRCFVTQKAFLWMAAARLSARLSRIRNAYPRGERFFSNNELEDWEEQLGELLWYDELSPGLYF
jgi:hypothetical protein